MPAALPPYLTSGASSRSHHALLVKLHEAKSDLEEDEILRQDIIRQKQLMAVKGQSTSKCSESLIVLLHIAMLRHDTTIDIDFGLVHALHLAESGRTIHEKRIGYTFLQERLTAGHELSLMLINTIRKDLSSASPSHILLALHTIVKIPSEDLAPAVTPVLISKALLKHKLPAIRQRTVQAICALHIVSGEGTFPLSMSKLVRMSTSEEDGSVSSVIIGTIKLVLDRGIRIIGSQDEALFLCEHIMNIAIDRLEERGQILLECIGVLIQIVSSIFGKDCAPQVSEFINLALASINIDEPAGGAMLLEICNLLVALGLSSNLVLKLLAVIGHGLRPSGKTPSTSQIAHIPKSNTHLLIIRCLNVLPELLSDAQLGEAEMGTLMEGLNSPDDTIRRSTLRLLQRVSPDLLAASFHNQLQALKTSSDLSLPLHIPANLDEKTIAGRLETSGRALEVVEIMYCQSPEASRNEMDYGAQCARSFVEIVTALNEGVTNSAVRTESSGGLGNKGQVWEEGLRRMLAILDRSSAEFVKGFTSGIIDTRIGSATLAVLRCTMLCKSTLDPRTADRAVQVLLEDLADFGPSVQEIVLVALSVILSQIEFEKVQVIDVIRQVQLDAGKYIKKRCGQVVDLIQQNLLPKAMQTARSRLIPDVLEAIMSTHKSWSRSQRNDSTTGPDNPASPARSISNTPSSLRYEAYEAPSSSLADLSLSRHIRESRSLSSPSTRGAKKHTPTPGDLALFDADKEDGLGDTGGRGGASSQAKLGRIAIPESTEDALDPFKGDEARTPTMRESRQVGI